MIKQLSLLIVLMVIFLSAGCSIHTFASVSDCESIKTDSKRDKCFTNLIEQIPLDNTGLKVGICNKISNIEMRDLCFFKVAHESWRFMSPSNLDALCDGIGDHFLKRSCKDIQGRLHLQQIR